MSGLRSASDRLKKGEDVLGIDFLKLLRDDGSGRQRRRVISYL